jgi:hypothetical protein
MRSQLGNLVLAATMALLATPVYADRTRDKETEGVSAPVAVQRVGVADSGVRDEAAMVLVGTALIALAAVVRRAS